MSSRFLVTGSAGFIGFHVSKILLDQGFEVVGVDALTDYYDVGLKTSRLSILKRYKNFSEVNERIENDSCNLRLLNEYEFDIIIHLAAQAGVRYSIEFPKEYLHTNVVGTFNILELARKKRVKHLLCASTSSVYGSNKHMPFTELQKCDTQMSFYAATKKSNEVMAHSYAHIHNIPITMFRFFTVYGPWGRPDMALFKFTKAMLEGKPIEIYNNGKMKRDFTYIDDLVQSIIRLVKALPPSIDNRQKHLVNDSLSDVAPWRVVNIGNSRPVNLMDYVKALEEALNIKSKRNMTEMQAGDVTETWADTKLLNSLTKFQPETNVGDGIKKFVRWYRDYYGVTADK